jgi:hypothetical protein
MTVPQPSKAVGHGRARHGHPRFTETENVEAWLKAGHGVIKVAQAS